MTMIRTAAIAAAIIGFGSAGAMAQGMSEPQARSVLLNSCNNVSSLSRDKAGTWHGMCSKGAMMVDRSGKVLADDGHVSEDLTEGQARATLLMACGNVSTLQEDTHGRWHGYCSKGAVMVDARGNVVVDRRDDTALTRGEARAIASNACGNVSSLSTDGKNQWMGTCSKGSFAIDPAGKLAFR